MNGVRIKCLRGLARHDGLGNLRRMMPPRRHGTVICDVPKNLLHLSPQDLPRVISSELDNESQVS